MIQFNKNQYGTVPNTIDFIKIARKPKTSALPDCATSRQWLSTCFGKVWQSALTKFGNLPFPVRP